MSETVELVAKIMYRKDGCRAFSAEEKAWCAQRSKIPLWLNVYGTWKVTLQVQVGARARQIVYVTIPWTLSLRLQEPTQSG